MDSVSVHSGQQILGHRDVHAHRSIWQVGADKDASDFDDIGLTCDLVECGWFGDGVAMFHAPVDMGLERFLGVQCGFL